MDVFRIEATVNSLLQVVTWWQEGGLLITDAAADIHGVYTIDVQPTYINSLIEDVIS